MIERRYADLFAQGSQVRFDIAEREIVLTYVLKILDEAALLPNLAFKGGTCLRKCVYGHATRFSEDLDFTSLTTQAADDVILNAVEALGPRAYGISFVTQTKDFYASDDGLSCGANIAYQHDWGQGTFKLEISLRESLSLQLHSWELIPQPYFKHLEFKPFLVPGFRFEEMLAEKIRACSQRIRARDIYDLAKAAEKPMHAPLIRSLAVIKCWNVGKMFDPARFLERLRTGRYDWDDLRPFVRKSERIDPERLISACERRYQFLLALTEEERQLIADAKKHKHKTLLAKLLHGKT